MAGIHQAPSPRASNQKSYTKAQDCQASARYPTSSQHSARSTRHTQKKANAGSLRRLHSWRRHWLCNTHRPGTQRQARSPQRPRPATALKTREPLTHAHMMLLPSPATLTNLISRCSRTELAVPTIQSNSPENETPQRCPLEGERGCGIMRVGTQPTPTAGENHHG